MNHLNQSDRIILEELFNMKTGYVLDLSNNSLKDLIQGCTGIDIYSSAGYEDYCSKAWKVRTIWNQESDRIVGAVNIALLEYAELYYLRKNQLDDSKYRIIKKMIEKSELLTNHESDISLPASEEESITILLEDIDSSINRGHPELVIDRLHTYTIKYLRELSKKHYLSIKDRHGHFYPLHSLLGSLCKRYAEDGIGGFSITALKSCISIFEKYNELRNDMSYAHDNPILNTNEASFAIRIMAEVLKYIETIEDSNY